MADHHGGTKRHARLRHYPEVPVLWVGDDEDWDVACANKGGLVCPEPGCDVPLTPVHNPKYRYNPRFFKFKPVKPRRECDHWKSQGGGGPESREHEWVKARLARMARLLEYRAVPEHRGTFADVFVEEAAFCLEVQLRPTSFATRTASRHRKGAAVCWFFPDGLNRGKVGQALFHGQGAVRFRVIDRRTGKPVRPWDTPNDKDLNAHARIEVFATVGGAPRSEPDPTTPGQKATWFVAGAMDGYQFLEEILAGKRRWYSATALGHHTGLWVLTSDFGKYQEFVKRRQTHLDQQSRERAQRQAEVPGPRPPSQHAKSSLSTREVADSGVAEQPHPQHKEQTEAASATSRTLQPPTPVARPAPSRRRPRRWWQFWRRFS